MTHIGCMRPTNQDAFLISNELGLWMVADGMSGHAGGDVASQKTIDAIHASVANHAGHKGQPAGAEAIPLVLRSAIGDANETVRAYAQANPEFTGMGTTVVLFYLPASSSPLAWIAHAGDSRAYLIRDQRMTALTRDHTVLEERIRQGLLPQSTPASHPDGHALTRGVGVSPTIEADVSTIELQATDEILLCSDGLTKMLNDEDILGILTAMRPQSPAQQCRALIDEANVRGGLDNTTVVLIAKSR